MAVMAVVVALVVPVARVVTPVSGRTPLMVVRVVQVVAAGVRVRVRPVRLGPTEHQIRVTVSPVALVVRVVMVAVAVSGAVVVRRPMVVRLVSSGRWAGVGEVLPAVRVVLVVRALMPRV